MPKQKRGCSTWILSLPRPKSSATEGKGERYDVVLCSFTFVIAALHLFPFFKLCFQDADTIKTTISVTQQQRILERCGRQSRPLTTSGGSSLLNITQQSSLTVCFCFCFFNSALLILQAQLVSRKMDKSLTHQAIVQLSEVIPALRHATQ